MTAAGKERKQSGGLAYDYDVRGLVEAAREARLHSYSPYSHFRWERRCLRRTAGFIRAAISKTRPIHPQTARSAPPFLRLYPRESTLFAPLQSPAVRRAAAGRNRDFCPPCGVCRQVMMEFCSPKTFEIVLAVQGDAVSNPTLEEPSAGRIGPGNLDGNDYNSVEIYYNV